jgi:hypothetical protein
VSREQSTAMLARLQHSRAVVQASVSFADVRAFSPASIASGQRTLVCHSQKRLPGLGRFRKNRCPLCTLPLPPATLSSPFPVGDLFVVPNPVFLKAVQLSNSARPELFGVLLWSIGLYFGLSQNVRWGEALRVALAGALPFSKETADSLATALHTLPFLFAAFGIDSALNYSTGGNSSWAVATGVGFAMYGVLFELARSSARSKKLDDTEATAFDMFSDFAARRLERTGRCHLQDIRAALRNDDRARRLARINDEQLRRFVRTWAPSAVRSRNGFYRNLSIRSQGTPRSIF